MQRSVHESSIQSKIKNFGTNYFYGVDELNDMTALDEDTIKSLTRQFSVALGLDDEVLSSARIPNTRKSLLS